MTVVMLLQGRSIHCTVSAGTNRIDLLEGGRTSCTACNFRTGCTTCTAAVPDGPPSINLFESGQRSEAASAAADISVDVAPIDSIGGSGPGRVISPSTANAGLVDLLQGGWTAIGPSVCQLQGGYWRELAAIATATATSIGRSIECSCYPADCAG